MGKVIFSLAFRRYVFVVHPF